MRKTNYGTLTNNEELDENEIALDYIIKCAREVGIEVVYGKTAISIPFIAKVMKAMKSKEVNVVLDKIRAEIEQEIAYKPMEMWDYRMGLTKALDIIDKYRKESEE